MVKKIISFLMAAVMILAVCPSAFAAEAPTWEGRFGYIGDGYYYDGWPFRPYKDTVVRQNSPDFSWPRIPEALSYDLIVCTDENLKEVKYEKQGLAINVYNFPYTFDVGEYWWSVRFKTENGVSEWYPASKFFVPKDAYVFTLPEVDDILSLIPKSHPRLGTTRENLDEFRTYKDKDSLANVFYQNIKNQVATDMETGVVKEPLDMSDSEYNGRSFSLGFRNKLLRAGALYLIDGDPKVGKFCVDMMMEFTTWNINGVTRYGRQDQCHRDFLEGMGFGFDFAYDCMTDAQRKKIAECIDARMRIHEKPTEGLVSDIPFELPDNPYRSHGFSATSSMLEVAMATYGDVPFSEYFLKKYLPYWINSAPIWGGEDGAWGNGTGYARWGTLPSSLTIHALSEMGVAELYNKAYFQNNFKFNLYLLGTKYGAPFGDEATGAFDMNFATYNNQLNKFTGNPYSIWQNEKYGFSPDSDFGLYYLTKYPNTPSKQPNDLPRSIAFEDTGYGALHSELVDAAGRVSLFFRAGKLGSYNHSHADNNSFTIVAYGEELAADTGYYDAYNSEHYNTYYQTSHAHNTITFDENTGTQVKFKRDDLAHINNFLTHPDFDLMSGTAWDSYNYEWTSQWGHLSEHLGKLERFNRNIIFVRPDQFVIIDDLKKADGKESNFEFWLNAKETLEVYDSKDGARITNKNSAMDLKVQYPKVTSEYSDVFSGNDLNHSKPSGSEGEDPVSKRVWFTTEPTIQTKMITTISVHKADAVAQYVDCEEYENYLILNLEDGTRVYVNLTDDVIEMKEYKTDADAVVVKKETVMAVNATTLSKYGEEILISDKPVSYVYGKDELSISCDTDANVKIKTKKITTIVNENNSVIEPEKLEYGYNWKYKDGYFKAYVIRGFYTMYLNNKPMPGTEGPKGTLEYIVDGKSLTAETQSYYNHDAKLVIGANIENSKDYYYLDKVSDIDILSNSKEGSLLLMNPNEQIFITGENPKLELRSLAGGKVFSGPVNMNHREVQNKLDILVEAEDYVFLESATGRPWQNKSYLSNNSGISWVHTFGDSVKWEFEVPESGEYYPVIKYAGWGGDENGNLNHLMDFNGTSGNMKLPATNTYGQADNELTATVCEQTVYLDKGKNYMWLYPKSGNWNIDWLGFIRK